MSPPTSCRWSSRTDGQSCLNLAAARLRYIAGTAWSAKCSSMKTRSFCVAISRKSVQTEAVA